MPGFFDTIREKVVSAVCLEPPEMAQGESKSGETIDNLISLGVLLKVVADADDKFFPEEGDKIEDLLFTYGHVSQDDMPIILRAIEEASINRIDLHAFTREVAPNLSFKTKIGIIENLFRIACADKDLHYEEHEMIRKISGLLNVEHRDFIDAKIRIKKDFGLDTAGL